MKISKTRIDYPKKIRAIFILKINKVHQKMKTTNL